MEVIDINKDWAHLIRKCISNDGELEFWTNGIAKPESETLCVALGDKHVRIS